jgi:uncharacterized membrane protein YoaK (UPF0700 family)
MTTNISVFTMDLGEIWFGKNQSSRTASRVRIQRALPAIAGFLVGCILGALCEPAFGLASFAVPTLLSLGCNRVRAHLARSAVGQKPGTTMKRNLIG